MNGFDKFCAIIAFLLGLVLLPLGALGLFTGCAAHFRLPPLFGVIPALAGWGIVRAVYFAWRDSDQNDKPGVRYEDRAPGALYTKDHPYE